MAVAQPHWLCLHAQVGSRAPKGKPCNTLWAQPPSIRMHPNQRPPKRTCAINTITTGPKPPHTIKDCPLCHPPAACCPAATAVTALAPAPAAASSPLSGSSSSSASMMTPLRLCCAAADIVRSFDIFRRTLLVELLGASPGFWIRVRVLCFPYSCGLCGGMERMRVGECVLAFAACSFPRDQ